MGGFLNVWCTTLGLMAALSLTSLRADTQQCLNCDCYHFPIPGECLKCCGVASGTITSVSGSSVVLAENTSNGQATEKTFSLKPNTEKNGVLKKGAPATVYYRKSGQVAERMT